MPFINIKITKEGNVTAEQKAALIKGATQLLVDVLGKNPKSTVVIIDEVETDNWGLGGESITAVRALAEEARAKEEAKLTKEAQKAMKAEAKEAQKAAKTQAKIEAKLAKEAQKAMKAQERAAKKTTRTKKTEAKKAEAKEAEAKEA